MEELKLKFLLEDADGDTPLPIRSDLASRVRNRVSRRRIRRQIYSCGFLLLGVLGIVAHSLIQNRPTPIAIQTPDFAAESRKLEAEAQKQEALINQLLRIESAGRSSTVAVHSTGIEPMNRLTLDRRTAAGILIARANELDLSPRTRPQATAGYRQIIALFSDTPQASIAKKCLAIQKT